MLRAAAASTPPLSAEIRNKKNHLPSNVAEGYVDVIRKLSRSGTSASPSGNLFATGKQLAERVPLALKHFAEEAQVSPS